MAARLESEPAVVNQTSMELEGDRTIVISRTFNGPARIVFDAWTRADLVKRWWVPRSCGLSVLSCDADVRAGGAYRYVVQNPGGGAHAFSGKYVEVTPHSRLVYTVFFEPTAGGVTEAEKGGAAVTTVTFDERDGKTRLVAREVYPSKEVREGVLASGMEGGMRESMDQLDEVVVSLR